ncbi:MAG: CAP domain-containing protein [Flavobacterium sp.]|nr:CAP domain-containing protein [Flavobacterium sp.]
MKKNVLIILIISYFNCNSQEAKLDLELLHVKVFTLVNNYRVSIKVKPLLKDAVLKEAAEDHSIYIAIEQSLTHEQSNPNKKLPKDRVYFYKGNDFVLVGENLLYTGIKDKIYKETDLDVLANKIIELWKNSPNHLKIMSSEKYSYTGFGFQLDWTNKKLYVAQVFGAK